MFRALADAPTSRGELISRLTKALKAKDRAAVMALFDWTGVEADVKLRQEAMVAALFEQDDQSVKSVKAASVPKEYPLEPTINGKRYHPNVEVKGLLKIEFSNEDNPMEAGFAYGTIGKGYYLGALVAEKPGAPAAAAPH